MSILAQNMKTIRKELKCTQSGMSDILKVGFRTYVRYEAGERDAPVSVMVKMARLANVSLEQLLTDEIAAHNLSPVETETLNFSYPEVKSVNFKAGKITFKKSTKEGLLAMDESEKSALALLRKMPKAEQDAFLKKLGRTYKATKANSKPLVPASKMVNKLSTDRDTVLEQPKKVLPKRKGKPGRRKVDKKALREKVNHLKKITKTINRITVR